MAANNKKGVVGRTGIKIPIIPRAVNSVPNEMKMTFFILIMANQKDANEPFMFRLLILKIVELISIRIEDTTYNKFIQRRIGFLKSAT